MGGATRQDDVAVEFPPFRLDLANHELWRDGERLTLRPKPFAVLAYLATNPHRLVPHAELVQAVWPDTHVGEGLLRGYVRDVRAVLRDDPATPRYVETVARLGYRFLAPVRRVVRAASARPAGVVGREAQLAELEQRLSRALAGERQIVFVTGEPGIGKTTLVDGFVARVASAGDVWTTRGQCVEHFGPSEAYLPVLEALGRLGRACAEIVPILRRDAPTWLAQLPGLVDDADLDAVQRRAHGTTRERMLRELGEALELLTAVRPLLLVVEDVQWSDASTIDLITSIARRREPARLLMLCTLRSTAEAVAGVVRDLELHGQGARVTLPPLAVADVEAQLADRLASDRIHAELAASVHAATDGNPLYVATLVDHWIARGVLVERDGAWEMTAGDDAGVPETLRHLLEGQLDRVSTDLRPMLDAASVVGTEFSTDVVAAALDEPAERVEDACAELASRALFLRAHGVATLPGGDVAGRFRFVHAVHRQLLYDQLAPARRVRLHRRIGAWLERTHADRAREHAAELAEHFARGHDPRAVLHLDTAARNAVAKHAYGEASALASRALALLPDDAARRGRELSLQMALGTSQLATRGYAAPEVESAFARARELARDLEGDPELVFALAGLYRFYLGRARLALARELGDRVLRLAEAHDPALLAVAHTMIGGALVSVAELAPAREHLERAVALYDVERHGAIGSRHADDPGVTSLGFLCLDLWLLGLPDQALQRGRQGEALAARLGGPYGVAFARTFLAWTLVRRGDVDAARRCSESLIALAEEQGFGFFAAEASVFHGWALAAQGDVDAGITRIRAALASHRDAGLEMGRPAHLGLLAEACARGRRFDEGLDVAEEGLATVHATGERSYEAELHRLKGELLRRKAETAGRKSPLDAQAAASIRAALVIARRQGARSPQLRAALSACRLRASPRELADAREALREVWTSFTEGFDTADWQAARDVLR
jgi:DNA-binding winged helix-turn-helix (wHTH) protein/predicted ATPase